VKNVPYGLFFYIGPRFLLAYFLMLLNAIFKGSGGPALKGLWASLVLGVKKTKERQKIQNNKKVTNRYIKDMLWDDLPPEQTGLRKLRKVFTGKS